MIMDKKKINIAIEQLERVHRDMNDCVNRFILKDAIDQLQKQVKNCSIPIVSGSFTAEDMEDAYRDGYENDYPREWDFNIDNYR